jgi:hypothetical protein
VFCFFTLSVWLASTTAYHDRCADCQCLTLAPRPFDRTAVKSKEALPHVLSAIIFFFIFFFGLGLAFGLAGLGYKQYVLQTDTECNTTHDMWRV